MNAIELTNIVKKYKDKTVVNNINLNIKEGELFSLLGTNGAGKTTTIKMISTLIKQNSGTIKVLGYDTIKDYKIIRNKINVSPQETAVAMNLTVYENLDFMANVYQIENKKDKIDNLIKTFKLEEVLKQKAKTLSGGYMRKLSIAISLINDPKILFLDEPTLGLDVLSRKELWNTINTLKGKITIILTTHYMEEAESLCDRIFLIKDGRKVREGTVKEVIDSSPYDNLEEAYLWYMGEEVAQ